MNPHNVVHQFGPFQFDPSQYELREGEQRRTLPPALNKLLLLFVSRPGQLVTREEIAATLWEHPDAVEVTPGINMAIKRLRTEIGDNNGHGVFIETVIGAGYRFAVPVSALPAKAAGGEQPPEAISGQALTDIGRTPWRPWLLPTVVGAVLILAAGGAWMVYSLRLSSSGAAVRPSSEATKEPMTHGHPVTFDEPEDQLTAQAVSPRGTYVAYRDRSGLTLQTVATGELRLLDSPAGLQVNHIAWFPDESSILLSGTFPVAGDKRSDDAAVRSQTWFVPLSGQRAHMLLDDASLPVVSPDGRTIAYLRHHKSEVWLSNPDGSAPHRLLQVPGDVVNSLLWTAQSKRIIIDRQDRQHSGLSSLAGADLGSEGPLSDNAPEPGDVKSHAIYETYDASSGVLLYRHQGVSFDSAAMLADGTLLYPVNTKGQLSRLAAVKTTSSTGAFVSGPQFIGLQKAFSISAFFAEQLTASIDGRMISAILDRPSTDVYTADLTTSTDHHPRLEHVERLTHHIGTGYPTSWSPDGREVIFDSGVAGPISIAAQPLDGSALKTLAASRSPLDKFAQGHVSPDGQWVLFLDMDKESSHVKSIDRVPIVGGTPGVVPTTGKIEEFRCSTSREGRCVLREVEGKNQMIYYSLDPVTGMGRELARTTWQPNVLGDWSLSPDGKTVAVANHDATHPAIQLVDLTGSSAGAGRLATVREIAVPGFGTVLEPNWASDGHSFLVETYTTAGYDLVSVDVHGQATLLRQSSELVWGVPSPDGKKIAFPGNTPLNRNVWVGTATRKPD
jgi:DNA-binding winged helix-turn-helix (wHTH) protein/Tol biopolymer transport system component